MRLPLALLCVFVLASARAELPTERYAPAQLRVAQEMLERARAAAAAGDAALAGRLAWQAGLDARLAWGMTESGELRAQASEIGGEAHALVTRLAR